MPEPADPIDPVQPPPSPPPPGGASSSTSATGLPSNVAAALACFPLIGGIIFYILEQRDNFVRFYAMQSIILGAAWLLFWVVWRVCWFIFHLIPGLGLILNFLLNLLWVLVSIAFLVVLIVAIFKAFNGERWDIPWVGPMARKQMGQH